VPNSAISSDSSPASAKNCRILHVGFVGGLEPPNNKHSGVVQIRQLLQSKAYPDVCAKSFSPYAWNEGRAWLFQHFPARHGPLTPNERLQSPKVILVGHSMGGWAIVSLARELRSHNIPVELTIQVDSVGINDHTIPRNVKTAAIFHANDVLMFMTTKHLRAEDAVRTRIIEDVKVDGVGHESITREPRIRDLVLNAIETLRASYLSAPSPDGARTGDQAARVPPRTDGLVLEPGFLSRSL
jgi:uncharacterized protein (UPF0147 family)